MRHDLQIAYTITDGGMELVGVDQAGKGDSSRLPMVGFRQKIFILGEQDAAELGGTIQNPGVVQAPAPILLNR